MIIEEILLIGTINLVSKISQRLLISKNTEPGDSTASHLKQDWQQEPYQIEQWALMLMEKP